MRTVNLLFIFLSIGFVAKSQIIDSISYIPQNPTWEDTLKVTCWVTYPTSPCQFDSAYSYFGGNGNNIILQSFCCCGIQTQLCHTYESFTIPLIDYYYYQGTSTYKIYFMPGFTKDNNNSSNNCGIPTFASGAPYPYPYVIDYTEVTISEPQNIKKRKIKERIKIFPNPTKGKAIIEYELAKSQIPKIEIYNNIGKLVYNKKLNKSKTGTYSINLVEYKKGIYFIKFISENNIKTEKLIIN